MNAMWVVPLSRLGSIAISAPFVKTTLFPFFFPQMNECVTSSDESKEKETLRESNQNTIPFQLFSHLQKFHLNCNAIHKQRKEYFEQRS